jgi:hypothetical protein
MPVSVLLPRGHEPERRYAAEVVFEDFLGLDCRIGHHDGADTRVSVDGLAGELCMADAFFGCQPREWLTRATVPPAPAGAIDPAEFGLAPRLVESHLPVLFDARRGEPGWVGWGAGRCELRFDPLGTTFFMLSRYEEVVSDARDAHDRFPAESDLAFRGGFLDRPIVDETVEVLWSAMQRLWPALQRRRTEFQLRPTHDVDLPFQHAFTSLPRMLLSCGADWVRRRDPFGPARRISSWVRTRLGDPAADPANTFDAIMDLSERAGLVSEFNFIVAHTVPQFDAYYDPRHPWILDLMRRIHGRGHRIGLHASYGSYLDPAQIAREFDALRRGCESLGIRQEGWGGRHHWLRFRVPDTFAAWEAAGLDFDSTLAYERCIGFRGGTCREFPVFDLRQRRRLKLRERPTIVMDASVTDRGTMNLGNGPAAAEAVHRIVARCRAMRGDCTILWHNSRLTTDADVALYRQVLAA